MPSSTSPFSQEGNLSDQGRWFKLWCSAPDDQDLDNLNIADFGRYCKLGTYTKEHGENGVVTLKPPSRALVAKMQLPDFCSMILCLKTFPHVTLEGDAKLTVSPATSVIVTFHNWLKFQGDFSTYRVRKMREMKRSKRRGEERRREEKLQSHKNETSPQLPTESSVTDTWTKEDLWLKEFLEGQNIVPLENGSGMLDHTWWELTSESCGGVDLETIQKQFAKMGAWLTENPGRTPRPKGWRRFVRGWLERSYDRERRFPSGGKK